MSAQLALSGSGTLGVLSANAVLSNSLTGKIEAHVGSSPLVEVSLKKKFWLNHSISPSLKVHNHGAQLGLHYHRRISHKTSAFCGCFVNASEVKGGVGLQPSLSAGLALKLTKYTKACYMLEVADGEVRAVFKVIRGGMNISVPVSLSNSPSVGSVMLGGLALALCAVVTKQLHDYFYADPLLSSKHAKKAEQRQTEINEGRRAAEEYVIMIRSKAVQSANIETERKGLVILEAFYGKFSLLTKMTGGGETTLTSPEIYSVTQQLQVLVEQHRLVMPAMSKQSQYGFFGPCLDREEQLGLFVKYSYGGQVQSKLVKDLEALTLP